MVEQAGAGRTLQVGIIGASAERGWAKASHVPAVQSIAGLMLGAVAAGSQVKSEAAAKAFGAKAAYAEAMDLIHDPDIDIVSICVKVPDHRDLVLAALAAKKHIYCEWPLGRNLSETEELAAAARTAGVHVAIGLQTRVNPAAQRARFLITEGAIGRLLSARIVSNTAAFGPSVEPAMAFAEDPRNGVTLLTIQGAHTFDTAIMVLGDFASLTSLATTQYPWIEVGGDRQERRTADHLFAQARTAGECPLSIEVAGGRPPEGATYRFEITGELGDLRLNGGAVPGFQASRLRLTLNGESQTLPKDETSSLPDAAANVAGMYAALRNDIVAATHTAPDFDHAVRLMRLLEDSERSSSTGTRRQASGSAAQD